MRVVAERGGVVGVTFVAGFLDDACAAAEAPIFQAMQGRARAEPARSREIFAEADRAVAGLPRPALERVVEHVEHIAMVGGIDVVGFGSDWDGFALAPQGMDDCSHTRAVLDRLRARGWSAGDIDKLAWQNHLRVFSQTFPVA